jgi:hypothetical protein
MKEENHAHMYINVSTGSKVTSITGILACMIWNGTPYYAHTDYDNIKKDPADGLPEEKINAIDELSVYSLNKRRPESLTLLQLVVDKNLSIPAKHSRLKCLLHPITVGGGIDNPLVEAQYRGK